MSSKMDDGDGRGRSASRGSRVRPAVFPALGGVVAVVAVCVIYYMVDPAEASWMPRCLFLNLTGLKCPGCGSQRMLHALLHGDVAGAIGANLFLTISLPLILFLIWLEIKRKRHPGLYAAVYSRVGIAIMSGCVLVWWLTRNIFGV